MKALILAGGMGTRLRPLTLSTPKPLLPLLDRPMVMHIIDSLPAEVDTVVLAVSYMKDLLEGYFLKHDCGRKVVLVNEEEPLGTGGAVRNVRQYLDGTFLCFNGDIISSLDLNDMLAFHRRHGGIGTLALWRVQDPSAFGVVGLEGARITVFQEKPAPGEAISDLINAGVYVFEPELLEHIPPGVVSLERQVFPNVLDRGLYGYRFDGHWVDCGTPAGYLEAQRALLERGRTKVAPAIVRGSELIGPNYIDGASLSGCRVGPFVCALPGASIGEGSTVEGSVLMEGATIGRGCTVRACLLGPGTVVKDGSALQGRALAPLRGRQAGLH
ncbi:MAG TPA: NDP-sugar synthase [Methanomassiliicoccales archaeon]|nr:NDP-sugar synthase [Methanomassiliicoccales archaeon]HOO04334.1 NDP-sugar synthase [Methanomassiliicoccales archaeon]HRR66022.1 NDP-sugar synthase [Methanomassiliicoccales archaeon]